MFGQAVGQSQVINKDLAGLGQVGIVFRGRFVRLFGGFLVLLGFMAALERPFPPLVVGLFTLSLNGLLCAALVLRWLGAPLAVPGAAIASPVTPPSLIAALPPTVSRARFTPPAPLDSAMM